jgi:hypothetical protein
MPGRAVKIALSRFSAAQAVSPLREELFWSDFVSIFSKDPVVAPCSLASCSRTTCPHKRIACWSPAVFADAGGRCGAVTAISLLVFNVERATDAQIYEVRGRIDSYRDLIHATHSDRPDSRCVRIIIALSRPVQRDAWQAFRRVAQTIVPIADPSCGGVDQIYFLPSVPRDAGYFIQVNEGNLLDVDATLVIAAAAGLVDPAVSAAESEGTP